MNFDFFRRPRSEESVVLFCRRFEEETGATVVGMKRNLAVKIVV